MIVVQPNNPFYGQPHQNERSHCGDISNEGHIFEKEILLHLSYCYFCIPINLEDVIYLQIEYVRWIRLYWVLFSIPSRMYDTNIIYVEVSSTNWKSFSKRQYKVKLWSYVMQNIKWQDLYSSSFPCCLFLFLHFICFDKLFF